MAAIFSRRAQARPARIAVFVISIHQIGVGFYFAVCQFCAVQIAGAVGGCEHLLGKARRFFQHRIHGVGIEAV